MFGAFSHSFSFQTTLHTNFHWNLTVWYFEFKIMAQQYYVLGFRNTKEGSKRTKLDRLPSYPVCNKLCIGCLTSQVCSKSAGLEHSVFLVRNKLGVSGLISFEDHWLVEDFCLCAAFLCADRCRVGLETGLKTGAVSNTYSLSFSGTKLYRQKF